MTVIQFNYIICKYGSIIIDTNGKKDPNMYGKDTYLFYILRQNGNRAYSSLLSGVQDYTNAPASTTL
jgi:hypothetical protein